MVSDGILFTSVRHRLVYKLSISNTGPIVMEMMMMVMMMMMMNTMMMMMMMMTTTMMMMMMNTMMMMMVVVVVIIIISMRITSSRFNPLCNVARPHDGYINRELKYYVVILHNDVKKKWVSHERKKDLKRNYVRNSETLLRRCQSFGGGIVCKWGMEPMWTSCCYIVTLTCVCNYDDILFIIDCWSNMTSCFQAILYRCRL